MSNRFLWLCSWYPNACDAYRGDFIQRHALATSNYTKLDVLHVCITDNKSLSSFQEVKHVNENLTEYLHYVYQKDRSRVSKIISWYKFIISHIRFFSKYKLEFGMPKGVHVHVCMSAGIIAMILKVIYRLPYVITEHYGIFNDVVRDRFSTRTSLYRTIMKLICKKASMHLAVSKYIAFSMQERVKDIPFVVVPNTVNEDLFQYQDFSKGSVFTFIHVGNYDENKNQSGILFAFAKLYEEVKNVRLLLVGAGYEQLSSIEKEKLKKLPVILKGEISHAEVALHLAQSNVLLLFSYMENSPCVIIEALASGVPVIATNVGGIPELVQEDNGLLVEPDNVEDFLLAMKRIINNYSQYNRKFISQQAHEKYGYHTVGRKILSAYREVFR